MTLAVLLDLVGELLEAPGFGLVNLAFEFADDVGDGFRQRVDLSLAQVLTRDKDMLVKRHDALPSIWPIAGFAPLAKPLRLSSTLHELVQSKRGDWPVDRSEEHTSELQSLMRISYAVFCLKNKILT